MKQSLNFSSNIVRSIATVARSVAFFFAFATAISSDAQILAPNQHIKIGTIPSTILQQMAAFPDSRAIDFAPQLLAAQFNSSVENTFKVPADGKITLKVKVTNKGNGAVNHTVRIELIDPTGAVKAKINEYIVDNNTPKTATLTAIAGKEVSGCGGANRWKYKVTNNDNVNQQATLVDVSAIIPDATGERSTYPTGTYTLTQNQFGDYVFRTPVGHRGRIRIKVRYTSGTQIEARLFKPGVEPAPNEANYAAIKTITETNQYLDFNFGSGSVDSANEFWTVRLRSKSTHTMYNVQAKVEFTDCSE